VELIMAQEVVVFSSSRQVPVELTRQAAEAGLSLRALSLLLDSGYSTDSLADRLREVMVQRRLESLPLAERVSA
jgi:hypothetical protein